MLKQIIPIALLGTIVLGTASCKKGGSFQKTKDGVEYLIAKDAPGTQKPAVGDIIEYHLIATLGDSTLFDSRKMMDNKPLQKQLQEPAAANRKMDPTEVIMMLTAGDSAVIRTELDSNMRQMYAFAKPTDKLEFRISLVSVKTKDQFEKEMQTQTEEQKGIDEKLLTDYFTQNNITAQKTASGLYYVITKEGSGAVPEAGKTVKVNYTGRTIDGNVFDSNLDPKFQHVEPLEFMLGRGQVIPGWDEGIALLKKGSKGVFYIPSGLAYGSQSPNPNIPNNAILIFDVELLDFK